MPRPGYVVRSSRHQDDDIDVPALVARVAELEDKFAQLARAFDCQASVIAPFSMRGGQIPIS